VSRHEDELRRLCQIQAEDGPVVRELKALLGADLGAQVVDLTAYKETWRDDVSDDLGSGGPRICVAAVPLLARPVVVETRPQSGGDATPPKSKTRFGARLLARLVEQLTLQGPW
jgi:hypothetical protein